MLLEFVTGCPRIYDWAAAQLPAVPFFDGYEPSHR
jgi:hypothetical protein